MRELSVALSGEQHTSLKKAIFQAQSKTTARSYTSRLTKGSTMPAGGCDLTQRRGSGRRKWKAESRCTS